MTSQALSSPLLRSHAVSTMLASRRGEFLGFVKKRVHSDADAEDLLQQALLRATEHGQELRQSDKLDAWFYRILRNVVADHRTARARRDKKISELAQEAMLAPPTDAAVCGCSLGMLERLRIDYAQILRLADIDEVPLSEVANALELSMSNTKVRLHRARKALRQELQSACGTDSVRACADCECNEPTNTNSTLTT